jgi:hypothetical protein
MFQVLDLQKMVYVGRGNILSGEDMLMSTASGICPTGQQAAEDANPFQLE